MKVGLVGVLVAAVVAFGVMGCGEDESLASACSNMVSCGQFSSGSDCELTMGAFVLSNPCLKAISSASCEGLGQEPPTYWGVCWDQCGVDGQHCSGDRIQMCVNGWELIADCVGICEVNGGTYVGHCGDSYGEQISEQDVCWCD